MKLKHLLKQLKIENDSKYGKTNTEIMVWFPETHCTYLTHGGKFADYDIVYLKRNKVYRKFLNLKIETVGLRNDLPNFIALYPKHQEGK